MRIAFHPHLQELSGRDTPFTLAKAYKVLLRCYHPVYDTKLCAPLLSVDELSYVHTHDYVEGVLSGALENGFGNVDLRLTHLARVSTSVMSYAMQVAVDSGGAVFAPVSGFHHAGRDYGGGFCTFNGIMVGVAILARRMGMGTLARQTGVRVLVLDGDVHYGDGTDDIINALGWGSEEMAERRPYIRNITHGTAGFRKLTAEVLVREIRSRTWDLVVYQAGADAHYRDVMGSGYLSDLQWSQRDRAVFSTCYELGVPVVFNLAGGYSGARTLGLHEATFREACAVYEPDRPRLLV